jgi:ornithine cyclodeaminase
MKPLYIDSEFIDQHTDYPALIEQLKIGFKEEQIITPPRHHHYISASEFVDESSLLLMPAWQTGMDRGVKILSVHPTNQKNGLPSIQGTYIYMDGKTGAVKAIIDGKALTSKRTAAASALASTYLSRPDASSMLMVGTGALSTELIKAHASIRPIEVAIIWGRNHQKAKKVASQLEDEQFEVQTVEEISLAMKFTDIISCATLSEEPLIYGKNLQIGQHIDLVGSYKPEMREADDETIKRASVFLDCHAMARKESGDILQPLMSGILKDEDIKADLFQLCSNEHHGRTSPSDITLFKSVGHALEDLIAARYYYKQFKNQD